MIPSIVLLGPTTVGKTDIAIALAQKLDGESINCDKFYLYRGLPSVTGIPDFSKHPEIKTHLYKVLAPDQQCLTHKEYAKEVKRIESEIRARGKLPILEGSYHQFVKSLLDNKTQYILIGIKLHSERILKQRIRKRIDMVLTERAGIAEVKHCLEKGWRDTYIMAKGSVSKPLLLYLEKKLTLAQAKDLAAENVLRTAYKAYDKFLEIPGVRWFKNDSSVIESILNHVEKHKV